MGRELADMIEAVRRMAGASGVTAGTIQLAVWLLGYRRVADAMPLPPVPPAPPVAEPATGSVDEIMAHLAPRP